jgi:hypothetical protein
MMNVLSINKEFSQFSKQFSICCISNNADEYAQMQQSFVQNGFEEDCEYLIADNTKENVFDAYEAINLFIKNASGKYIIVVHQDVRAIDNKTKLLQCLDELDRVDKNWAVCGNAGGVQYHESILYISHVKQDNITDQKLPKKVRTLDENFLILKKAAQLSLSIDISGFHLYGTDLCLLAQIKGYHCYVIPFLVKHLSEGNLKDLQNFEKSFIQKYGQKMSLGLIQTTCTRFYLSNSSAKNMFFNSKAMFFFVKRYFSTRRSIIKLLKKKQ